jgi:hypothetical protein
MKGVSNESSRADSARPADLGPFVFRFLGETDADPVRGFFP